MRAQQQAPYRIGQQQQQQQTWQPTPVSIGSVEPPAHVPGWPLMGATSTGPSQLQHEHSTQSPASSSSSIRQTPQATSSPQSPQVASGTNQQNHHHQHQQQHNHHHQHQWQPAGRLSPAAHVPSPSSPSQSSSNVPLVPGASQQQASLPPSLPPLDNPLIELLRQQQQAAAANSQPAMANGNPLLFTLIVMSLIISIALIALLIIGTTSSGLSQASMRRHKHPLDK